jgi:hypothetical protein
VDTSRDSRNDGDVKVQRADYTYLNTYERA